MAKTCSKGKESEERVEAAGSHPINAVNADHNAGVACTNMANVSRLLWTESGPRGVAEGRGGGGSGMQDTVKLPAESPHPRVGGWVERTLSTPRPWTTVQPGICLVSLFMRFNIVIWHRTGEF
ncbi:hypothetical protein HZU67_09420 [Apis mellifera carnica]|nr:hypothetical protein HZU67_09420 [Apis mellifera carnica]